MQDSGQSRPGIDGPRALVVLRRIAAIAVVSVLAVGCGDDSADPDPGAPGGETELDGGETGSTDGGASSTVPQGSGGGGGTQGNQIGPGDTTRQTAQDG